MNDETKKLMEETRAKHLRPDSKYGLLSLASMKGKKVIDMEGYISLEFGLNAPVFNVSAVVFEDGTTIRLQGEHDIAYLCADDDEPGLTNKDLLLAIDPNDIDEAGDEEFQEYLEAADDKMN
jgi:hypothetical protein